MSANELTICLHCSAEGSWAPRFKTIHITENQEPHLWMLHIEHGQITLCAQVKLLSGGAAGEHFLMLQSNVLTILLL